jgi:hypothetical protein
MVGGQVDAPCGRRLQVTTDAQLQIGTPFDEYRLGIGRKAQGGGNRTDLPSASNIAPTLQVHCNTMRSEDSQMGTLAGGLRGDCSDMQKENAISMPKDLAGVVAAWSSLSDDQKAQIIGIAKDNLK